MVLDAFGLMPAFIPQPASLGAKIVTVFSDNHLKQLPSHLATIFLLDKARNEEWMQSVAAEMNLAETAFTVPEGDDFHIRWFTPTVEVDLCGHATLASAHVLWEAKRIGADATARFHTRSGWLTARRQDGLIELDFPSLTTTAEPTAVRAFTESRRQPHSTRVSLPVLVT